ncbi:MAG: diguanylate cyclase [Rhodocyclaceae bacterium]|nr:diguanylate cyclase [Rhodocyclaceae bacterium]MDZ4215476.1 diguanylate cyclase [Rhodocyclaceae bacterium]
MLTYLKDYTYKSEVSPEYFAHMTDWLLNWCRRETGMSFSLVLIDFKNPSALGDVLGAKYAMDLVKRVGKEIESSLRATDLLCRTRVSSFWVLLPKGEPGIVLKKLDPILSAAQMDGLDATQLHIRKLQIPGEVATGVTATELFRQMQIDGS